MRWLADLVYLLTALAYLPKALYDAIVRGKNRRGWWQRFGWLPMFDPAQPRIWLHAVSLGEINATPPLVSELHRRRPDIDIVVSTTTDTGYARAVQLYGADHVFRSPLDFSPIVNRAFRRIRPALLVLVELEVWFNLVRSAAQRGVSVAVVNGRLTERSARRLRRLRSIGRSMFANLTWVGAQDEAIAERFRSLGTRAERVTVTSSLKWDSADLTNQIEGSDRLAAALGLDDGRLLWVCGSTGPGEEALILNAYAQLVHDSQRLARDVQGAQSWSNASPAPNAPVPVPRLAIVPRKPERFDEVARLIEAAGFACVRRSTRPDNAPSTKQEDRAVVLGDTIGELRKFYSLADVVFVGRSLVPMGGSDPIEVAALGKPIVIGPCTENFDTPVRALRSANAISMVTSIEALATRVQELLADRALRDTIGQRARRVVVEHQGATDRTVDALVGILQDGRPIGDGKQRAPIDSETVRESVACAADANAAAQASQT